MYRVRTLLHSILRTLCNNRTNHSGKGKVKKSGEWLPNSLHQWSVLRVFKAKVKRKNQPKWFNTDILKELKMRDNLLKKARRSNSDNDWALNKQAKYNVLSLITKTKQAYFNNKINENKNNSRKLWNLIKRLMMNLVLASKS